LLVSVTFFTALVLPSTTEPKLKLVGESVTGARPVPVSAAVCVPASSTIVSVPVALPAAVGANETEMAQEAPAATLAVQVLV
jgi:hypothetical protein